MVHQTMSGYTVILSKQLATHVARMGVALGWAEPGPVGLHWRV